MNSSKLVIGLALLILGGLAGYFLGAGYPVFENEPTTENEEGAIGETILREVSSEAFGISFSYLEGPDGYVLVEQPTSPDTAVWTLIDTDEWNALKEAEAPREGPPSINIAVFPAPEGASLEEWLAANPDVGFGFSTDGLEEARVGGVEGIRFSWDGLYQGRTVAVTRGGNFYIFVGTHLEEGDAIYDAFNELLESVSFAG